MPIISMMENPIPPNPVSKMIFYKKSRNRHVIRIRMLEIVLSCMNSLSARSIEPGHLPSNDRFG